MITELLKLELEQYIIENYVPLVKEDVFYFEGSLPPRKKAKILPRKAKPHPGEAPKKKETKHIENKLSFSKLRAPVFEEAEATFQETLLKYIDEKGLTDVEVYKAAWIDRKHFSKIRSNKDYAPRKDTVIKFCLALSLNIEETKDLLEKAGFTLSKSIIKDIIIEFCIRNRIYNLIAVNEYLDSQNQPIL